MYINDEDMSGKGMSEGAKSKVDGGSNQDERTLQVIVVRTEQPLAVCCLRSMWLHRGTFE